MLPKFFNKFKGDRKYFAIVFFIIILILITGIITPIINEKLIGNWDEELTAKISNIQNSVTSLLDDKINNLLYASGNIKAELSEVLKPGNRSYGALIKLVNSSKYSNYSVEVIAPNGKLIAWNTKIAVPQSEIFPLQYPPGEVYFHRSGLLTYLSLIDTLQIENDQFYFLVSSAIEKSYNIKNPYYQKLSFTDEVSNLYLTQFQIYYTPFAPLPRDGRKYSFPLLNNKESKIGLAVFYKPTIATTINSVQNSSTEIQSILIAFGLLFIGFGFKGEYKNLRYRSVKLLVLVAYLSAYRAVLYYIGFPASFIGGALSNPAYFSSAFAGGIVKSPVEFFVTNIFLLIFGFFVFYYIDDYIHSESYRRIKKKKLLLILIPVVIFIFMLTLRGLNASIKSVIFDSTLRYFKVPDLIPNLPSIVMNLNILMLGLSVILLLCGFLFFLFSLLPNRTQKLFSLYFGGLFILFQILGIVFLLMQRDPLITPLISIVFISIIFIVTYQIYYRHRGSIFNYVYITLAASIISITLLNYFNLGLERESLKTTAYEINRPNDNLLRFMVNETLNNTLKNNQVLEAFSMHNIDYNSLAFIIWGGSSLQKESLNSSVAVYDKEKNKLGSFSVGISEDYPIDDLFSNDPDASPDVSEKVSASDPSKKVFAGVIPVTENGAIVGYISASVSVGILNIGAGNLPNFLESHKNILNSVIDISHLKIFSFTDNKLTEVYGDIYPSRDQIEPILRAEFSSENEAWITLSLNDENYLTYILKSDVDGSTRITSVSYREKEFTWNLFNFFKIFIVQSIFIAALFILLFVLKIKDFQYSFRTQLLFAFLFISIIPVIVLAVYNRQIVDERSRAAIFNELNERSGYVERHINSQLKKDSQKSYMEAFENAAKELGISFSVYDGSNSIFNSKEEYYKAGLFPDKLNPEAYYQLNYLSYREYLHSEKINNFTYNSFYKRFALNGRNYIIGVNDAFNKVRLSFSIIDVDVFLFGIYSFATIIIIIISTFLANRISAPIRRLTKATNSIAHGDLNVQLENKEKGEIRDLINGFNSMTLELQKNQTELAEMERENAWKEMAKQVAHEIKNPLTPMKLAVQQLTISYRERREYFDSIFEKVSATILKQIENLSLIASEFSRFARMPNYKLEVVDLIPELYDTVNLFVDEKTKISVNTELNSASVEADKTQLRRMFINLIRNSIQAGSTRVDITVFENEEFYNCDFSDNGKGVPAQIRDRIFEANFTTKEKGMGIGLKLAKRFLESINGNIKLIDSSGAGSKFKIIIPKYLKSSNNS